MALVNITNVVVMDNPTAYTNPFQFEVTFECLQELQDDIEWKVTYVGCAEDSLKDQVLEEVMVGPIPVGVNRFVLQANAPNPELIATSDLIGVTVVLITCSYMDQEFVKIGYYVNNEYNHPSYDPEGPLPSSVDIQYLFRNILADKPIVTRVNIDWSGQGNNEGNGLLEQPPHTDIAEDDKLFQVDDDNFVVNDDSMDVERMH